MTVKTVAEIANQKKELSICEAEISEGTENIKRGFVKIGRALKLINQKKLYKHETATFKDYIEKKYNMSTARAYQFISAYDVYENLSTRVDILNITEGQLRPLTKLNDNDQIQIYKELLDETEPDQLIPASMIKNKVNQYLASNKAEKVKEQKTPEIKEYKPDDKPGDQASVSLKMFEDLENRYNTIKKQNHDLLACIGKIKEFLKTQRYDVKQVFKNLDIDY